MFGFLKTLFGPSLPKYEPVNIDMGKFTCGLSRLGAPPDSCDFFAAHLQQKHVYEPEGRGVQLTTDEGVFDSMWIKVDSFDGSLFYHGRPMEARTLPQVKELLGEPYFVESDEDSTILSYVFDRGKIEVQFEFDEDETLEDITLEIDGVLSDPGVRKQYGITKPWPPQ